MVSDAYRRQIAVSRCNVQRSPAVVAARQEDMPVTAVACTSALVRAALETAARRHRFAHIRIAVKVRETAAKLLGWGSPAREQGQASQGQASQGQQAG